MRSPIRWKLAPRWIFVAAWVGVVNPGCALPTLEDAGKDRCNSKDDCLGGLRCVENVCSKTGELPSQTNPCPEKRCPRDYECHWGVCTEIFNHDPPCEVAVEAVGCTQATEACCPSDAICTDEAGGEARCYGYAECTNLDDCPKNRPRGVICSDLVVPGKRSLCLPGRCENAENCPPSGIASSTWACVGVVPGTTLGECTNGEAGMPCRANADCLSLVCDMTEQICGE